MLEARLCAAAVLAVCCPAWGSAGLTEREAIMRALARPAFVEVEASRLAAAGAAVSEAGRLPNPVLTLERERLPAPAGRSTESSIRLEQSVDLAGRRGLRVDAAQQRLAASRYESRERRLEAVADTRRAFAESLHREQERRALERWAERVLAAGATVERLARAGQVSGYDRRRLEREAHAARARAAASAGESARARERLAGLMGEPPVPGAPIGELMPQPLPPLDEMLSRLKTRPDLAALAAQAESFERERRLAQLAWAPELVVGVGQKRVEEPLRSDTGLVLSLAFPLPVFDRGESRHEAAAAQARALRGERVLRLARHEAELRGAWHQASELRSAAAALRAVPASQLSRIAEAAYRAGEGGVLELLDAYRAELDAELALLDLELRARNARIELDALAGVEHE